MKKLLSLGLIYFFIQQFSLAGENPGKLKNPKTDYPKAVACSTGIAAADLDIGNVRAKILVSGDMWWDLSNAKYEVPKNSGKHSMYTGALWIGGIDLGGQIKVAAQTYRQAGTDFWPGPIDTVNVSTDAAVCIAYDKFWKVTRASIIDFVQNGTTTPEILSWPGNGNVSLNQANFLAPFNDVNGDGIYDPAQGDYPNYDLLNSGSNCGEILFGDQTLWWAFNDVGNLHTESSSDPLGLEIHAQAFAYNSGVPDIDNATFYQYKIINRSSATYNQSYIGMWVDPDLGNAVDDYVGCDVNRGMGYCYNGDADDNGADGYGVDPPAIGVDFLQGPLADPGDGIDNNRDGYIDEPGEEIIMAKFVYYENINNVPNGNPNGFLDIYNYLHGTWLDNIPLTYGADGRNPSNPLCNFMFPDNTDSALNATNGPWTEVTAGNVPDDRRFLLSAGPFTMLPGEVNYVVTGIPWARTAPGGGPAGSVAALKLADDVIQLLFDNCFVYTGIEDLSNNPFQVEIKPVPFHDVITVSFANLNTEPFTVTIYDIQGKIVKQIKNITGNQVIINRDGLNSGIYIFQLADGKGRIYVQKVIAA